MKPRYKSGAFQTFKKGRFSNYGVSGIFQDLGTGGDYSDVDTHLTYHADGTPVSSGNYGDWIGFFNNLINGTSSVLTSIYGHNNQWQANAYNTMYQQEKRTNTILWVIIGLVVALGIVLIIRKK